MADQTKPPKKPKEPAWPKLEAITEMMELIFLFLPVRSIFGVKRVSKRWHTIINDTTRLQKALFVRPMQNVQLSLVETRGVVPVNCTSWGECYRYRGARDLYDPESVTRWATDIEDERQYRIVLNPLLNIEVPWAREYFHKDQIGRRKGWLKDEASWRDLLFAQPPLKEVMVRHGDRLHWHLVKAKEGSLGLTLDDVRRSKEIFRFPVRAIWGEDGFSRGVPAGGCAYDVLSILGMEPSEENDEEVDEEIDEEEDAM